MSVLFDKCDKKAIFRYRNAPFYRYIDRRQSLKIQNGQCHTYCINMQGMIHQSEKGFNQSNSMMHDRPHYRYNFFSCCLTDILQLVYYSGVFINHEFHN